MMGITFVRDLAILMRSRPGRCANSTAYTQPVGPTISDTCDTVVPAEAPRYKTLEPGPMKMLSTPGHEQNIPRFSQVEDDMFTHQAILLQTLAHSPPRLAAANFDRQGFQRTDEHTS